MKEESKNFWIYVLEHGHIYLKRYRIIQILIILFFMWMAYKQWNFYEDKHMGLKEWMLAGFISMNAATIGALKYALDSINTRHSADD